MTRRFSQMALLLVLSSLPGGCFKDGLIGGECRSGYAFCGGDCISIIDDEQNCGSCDNACPRSLACVDGLCGGEDGDIPLGAGGSGGSSGGISGIGGSAICLPPYSTPEACGGCDIRCSGGTPVCGANATGNFECVSGCESAEFPVECGNTCVDVDTDARHCGSCDNRCASGICVSGDCLGKSSGHMVALCMSFEEPAASQTRLLANAVFLGEGTPVRVLSYARDTSPTARLGTDISAQIKGRTLEITEATSPDDVSSELNRSLFDVFLVYDQEEASSGELAAIADSWRTTVDTFTALGGVVVVLTGGAGTSEMHEMISGLGIFSASGTSNHAGRYYVQSPGDAIGINVVSPFRSAVTGCTFTTAELPSAELVFVVTGSSAANTTNPAAVHRTLSP
jgi:hypothetical protein